MFPTSIAGSLPKPAWLAETHKLWPQWKAQGDELRQAKADATLLWIKAQEDAGLDIVTDGEQSRQHFVHGFLEQVEGIDFEHKVKMGIRDNRYDAMVPQVVAPLKLKGRVHAFEAQLARAQANLTQIADHFKTDKGNIKHNYTDVYEKYFASLRQQRADQLRMPSPDIKYPATRQRTLVPKQCQHAALLHRQQIVADQAGKTRGITVG